MTNYQRGDVKFYYQIHCARQKALGNHPLSYGAFQKRLKKMNLHDAIYSPRVEYNVRDINRIRKSPVQDVLRRRQTLKDENVMVVEFTHMKKVEQNKTQMPKPKKSLLDRFISFFTVND